MTRFVFAQVAAHDCMDAAPQQSAANLAEQVQAATQLKTQGNEAFLKQKYASAEGLYRDAIARLPPGPADSGGDESVRDQESGIADETTEVRAPAGCSTAESQIADTDGSTALQVAGESTAAELQTSDGASASVSLEEHLANAEAISLRETLYCNMAACYLKLVRRKGRQRCH